MQTQWPLVIFTLFVCVTSGTLGMLSIFALKDKAEKIQMPAVILAAVSLVVGGVGSFTHLQHWERIFNGFGHITSGITQELIGCVVLAVLIVIWFVMIRGQKTNKALAWVTLIASIAMVAATAHSYWMAGRPAWGVGLEFFYLGNACLLGPVVLWALTAVKADNQCLADSINFTFVGGIIALVTEVIFIALAAGTKFTDVGHYLNPTLMTTAPTHIDNVASIALTGAGAPLFWLSLVCAAATAVCAFMAKKNPEASKALMAVALIAAFATSIMFRVVVYMVGYPVLLVY
ncbi:Uncharacterised protein [Slackia heliotrinireducens]|uniref:DMSO reductase anchor subunit n=1 Tax=Slackia heliotrinireducens (strain ATCC 29202 / DSM 20476 / NCTC 11029 / RHS 1) TaxID=471855 RepID=C7N3K8_SLAHD|nr:DmsC/YnfH family molybdoenzyme membrane anchor subunit [Slackia heliotrinireducens]ACV23731.1 hypothetical protein Shel_27330 [Slackia heliotrinireducens DSM 20476]VEH03329.1 Uncharacterised protein [Slackia heliotrinireducens]